MRLSVSTLIAPSIIVSAALMIACGGGSEKDGGMTATDASLAGAPASQSAGAPSRSEARESRSITFVDQVKRAESGAAGGTAGSAAEPPSGLDPLSIGQFNTGGAAMMIRTGQAFIEVERLDPAVLKVRQLAAQVGGFIANSSISGGRDQIRQATFEIKVPAAKYDEAVGSLSTIGKIETVSSSAQDVGEEFFDITARVANAKRLEDRLLSLLANRTGKLDEVLRVERELARIREEIERYEGRLRYLSARVAMSTLTVTIHEPGPILGGSPGENPIAAALRRAWRNFVGLIAAFIASLGVLIPLGALGALAWIGYRRWSRRRAA